MLEIKEKHNVVERINQQSRGIMTSLRAWEVALEHPISLLVVPPFAFLNVGLVLSVESLMGTLTSAVGLGVIAGLLLGKPLGMFLAMALCLKQGLGELPAGMKLSDIAGIGLLAGMCFTMSIFVDIFSFSGSPETLLYAKTGIMHATLFVGISGLSWLWLNARKTQSESQPS